MYIVSTIHICDKTPVAALTATGETSTQANPNARHNNCILSGLPQQKRGKPVDEPFRVTQFESPGQMVFPVIGTMEISLSEDRLVVPIMEVSGNIWMLENVDQ